MNNNGFFPCLSFNDSILKKHGNKINKKGVIKEKEKLDATSKRRCICVFLYT